MWFFGGEGDSGLGEQQSNDLGKALHDHRN